MGNSRQALSVLHRQHVGIHRVLHGVDDVWRHRHSDQEDAWPQRDAIRSADRHAGADRLADPRAAGHVDRQIRRPHRLVHPDAGVCGADLADKRMRPSTGSSSCSDFSSGWPAARSRSAHRMSRAGFRASGRDSRWASSARATPAPRSTSSSRQRWSSRSAGRWCRRSTQRSCWAPRCCSGSSATPIRATWSTRRSPGASSSRR